MDSHIHGPGQTTASRPGPRAGWGQLASSDGASLTYKSALRGARRSQRWQQWCSALARHPVFCVHATHCHVRRACWLSPSGSSVPIPADARNTSEAPSTTHMLVRAVRNPEIEQLGHGHNLGCYGGHAAENLTRSAVAMGGAALRSRDGWCSAFTRHLCLAFAQHTSLWQCRVVA